MILKTKKKPDSRAFISSLSHADDSLIKEALSLDSADRLHAAVQAEKRKKAFRTLRYAALASACFCLFLLTGVLVFNRNGIPGNSGGLAQIANPYREVGSVEEMETALGYPVPLLDKKVKTFFVVSSDKKTKFGQIVYEDGSVYRIGKGSGDISGIYGGTITEIGVLSDIPVSFFHYEGTNYATWKKGGFSNSYESNGSCKADVISILEKTK